MGMDEALGGGVGLVVIKVRQDSQHKWRRVSGVVSSYKPHTLLHPRRRHCYIAEIFKCDKPGIRRNKQAADIYDNNA
jgi:hypothetical protein